MTTDLNLMEFGMRSEKVEKSFPFESYKYPILDESDGVLAYRSEFPVDEGSILGINVLIYVAESVFAKNKYLFLVVDENTKKCLGSNVWR